jgi:hypothetical protein
MPRKPTEKETGVPLWLIPQVILKWIRVIGEELDWIWVRPADHHLYTVRIRARTEKQKSGRAGVLGVGA